jgi:hypothetical protein
MLRKHLMSSLSSIFNVHDCLAHNQTSGTVAAPRAV